MIERAWPTLLVVAACLGLVLSNALWLPSAVLVVALLLLATSLAVPSARLPALALALAVAGWGWGSIRLDALDRSLLASQVGRTGTAELVVTGPARRATFALRVPADARRFVDARVDEPVLLELPLGRSPPQGAILALRATIVAPRASEEGFDERGWLARRGVHVILRGRDWRVVDRRGGIGGLSDRLREHVARSIAPGLEGERRAVLAGIVLGEDEGLSKELQDSFKAAGLYHLLAVSGQNVAFLAGAVLVLGWLLGIARLPAEAAAIGAIVAYVLAVGWQPSVVRAGVAGILASLAWLVSRPRDRWHFLAIGAAILLAWTPATVFEPGFQLSFAAVAAIFLLVPRLSSTLEGYPLPRWLREALAISVACGVATAPILWLQFGSIQVYSLLANALVTLAIGPLLGIALLGTLLEPVVPSASLALAWLNGWLAAYIAACARVVAGLPLAQTSSGLAVAGLLVIPAGILLLRRLPPWRRPLALTCIAAGLPALLLWQLWPARSLPPPEGLRITVLDVGQGDSILVQVPEGAILVDQGPPEAKVDRQLRELGVRRLAALVLTDGQRDHTGGAEQILRRVTVERVLDPRIASESPYRTRALAVAAERRIPVVEARAGASWGLGGLRIRVLWPDGPGLPSDDPNRRTVVLLASYGEVDALLSADAETDVTAPLHGQQVEILKVAHHGSEDPGLEAELSELRPAIAVISCGRGNRYGHPRAETIAALATIPGLRLQRTDRDGRVVVESDGARVWVRSDR
ncbi:MAG: DNA internalization-related competence protein ComEC/Rec2 [Gaiellaceae bacterium MAG52_C11]|nr:DNA internalization-related competence protein ComEC/Rec2 [Candidatus Gaiellasilicea maunaloa]